MKFVLHGPSRRTYARQWLAHLRSCPQARLPGLIAREALGAALYLRSRLVSQGIPPLPEAHALRS